VNKFMFVVALVGGYLAGRRSRRKPGWFRQVRANRASNRSLHDPSADQAQG